MRLSTSQDACGHMIYDHFHGTSTVEIVERDDGLIMAGRMDAAHYLSEFDDWPEWDREAAKHVHGRVLDIGCGGGRWCLYFQQKDTTSSASMFRPWRSRPAKNVESEKPEFFRSPR